MRYALCSFALTGLSFLPACLKAPDSDEKASQTAAPAAAPAVAPGVAPGVAARDSAEASKDAAAVPMAESVTLHLAAHGGSAEAEAPGCVHEDHDPASCGHGEPPPAAGSTGHFGQPFTLASRRRLAQAVADFADLDGQAVQVTGTVGKVCQKKGCWMVIEDGDVHTRVLMEGHFGVPMDGQGKAAVVEGTLSKRTFTEEQVKHLAQDGGDDPSAVAGERAEYVMKATGVEFSPQS